MKFGFLLDFLKKNSIVILSCILYIFISLPIHGSTQHVLANLEPYPDSFGYLTPVDNLIKGKGFEYSYQGTIIPQRMPPLYSIVLLPFFYLTKTPISFYATNMVLGIISIVGLYLLLKTVTKNAYIIAGSMLLYLAHGYIFIVLATPMAENLVLPLFIWAVYLLRSNHRSLVSVAFASFCVVGLLLTKYVYVVVGCVLGCLFLYQYFRKKSWKNILIFIGFSLLLLVSLVFYLQHLHWSSFTFVSDISAFSIDYIKKSSSFYFSLLLGKETNFLWYTAPLSSFIFLVTSILFLIICFTKKRKKDCFQFGLLYSAHFILLLFYFYLDARFVVTIIVLNIVFFAGFLELVSLKNWQKGLLYSLAAVALVFSQKSLYRTIISQNILGNSRAWHYESVQTIGGFLRENPDIYFVTALHPPLFTLYDYDDVKLLPLSTVQEFSNDHIWRDSESLPQDDIERKLVAGKKVYISNAYITANQAYTTSFEELKTNLDFILEQEGCLGTCSIYSLSLKQ